jgi:hypothetical protein
LVGARIVQRLRVVDTDTPKLKLGVILVEARPAHLQPVGAKIIKFGVELVEAKAEAAPVAERKRTRV